MCCYGVIDIVEGRLVGIHLRPFPKFVSLFDVLLWGRFYHIAHPRRSLPAVLQPAAELPRLPGPQIRAFVARFEPGHLLWRIWRYSMKSLASSRSDAIVTDVANFRIYRSPVGPPRLGTPCCQPLAPQLHQAAFYGQYPSTRTVPISSAASSGLQSTLSMNAYARSPNDKISPNVV